MDHRPNPAKIAFLVAKVVATFALFGAIVWFGTRTTMAELAEYASVALGFPTIQWAIDNWTMIFVVLLLGILLLVVASYIYRSYQRFVEVYARPQAFGLAIAKAGAVGLALVAYDFLIGIIVQLFGGQVPAMFEGNEALLALAEMLLSLMLATEVGKWFERQVLPTEQPIPNLTGEF